MITIETTRKKDNPECRACNNPLAKPIFEFKVSKGIAESDPPQHSPIKNRFLLCAECVDELRNLLEFSYDQI